MMTTAARVIASNNQGWITVEVIQKSACNHCQQQDTCGTGVVAKAFDEQQLKTQQFSIATTHPYQVGDELTLALPESVVLRAAALVYLLPLLGLFCGGFVGDQLGVLVGATNELPMIFASSVGALLSWLLAKRWAKSLEKDSTPIILPS